MTKLSDIRKMDGCIVRDSRGVALAVLHEVNGVLWVKKTTGCSLGTYLYVVSFLRDFGYEVR